MIPTGNNTVAGNMEAWITLEGMQQFVGDLKSGMSKARSELTKVSRDVKKLGLLVTGIGIAATKMASDLAAGVSEISTLSEYTKAELDELEAGLRKTRMETGQSLKNLQSARYDIISAGFTKIGESQKFMEASARAAVGAVAQVSETASSGLSILQNYGMAVDQIDHVYDVLQTIIRLGRTKMSEVSPYIAPVVQGAIGARVQLEDLGALISTTTIGMGGQTAKGMTALKGALRGLVAPTEEAVKYFKEFGIQVYRLDDGTMDVLKTFRQFQGMDLATIRKIIPDVEAAEGVQAIAININKLESDLQSFGNVSGAYMSAWNKRADDFDIKLKRFIARGQDILITIGQELIPELEKGIGKLSSKMDEFLPKIKAFASSIGDIVGWAVEHGDLLGKLFKVAVIAKITTMLYRTGGALYYVASGIKAISAAKYLNPVTFGIAAITVAAIAVTAAIKKYRNEQAKLNSENVEFSEVVQDVKKESADLINEFETLTGKLLVLSQKEKLSNEELKIQKDTIQALQSKFPGYFKDLENSAGKYDTLKTAIEGAKIELDKYIDNVIRSAVMQEYSNRIVDSTTKIIDYKTEIQRLENANEKLRMTFARTKEEQDLNTQAMFNNNFAIEAANILLSNEENKLQKIREAYALASQEAEKYAKSISKPTTTPAAATPGSGSGANLDDTAKRNKKLAEINYEAKLAEIAASGEDERLQIRKKAIEDQLALLDSSNEGQLDKWRDLKIELAQVNRDIAAEQIQIQKEYVDFAVDSVMNIGNAIGSGLTDAQNGWKDILKSILLTTITAIEKFAILAKIQNAIRMQFQGGILSPKAWIDFLSNNAFLLAQLAGLEAAKGAIMALAEGAFIARPTLALIGEAGPEIVAPERNFLDYLAKVQNQGSPEQVKELKILQNDVRELNKTMKKFRLTTITTSKGIETVMKHKDAKEKRNKL